MRKLRWISILLLVAGAAGLGYRLRADWRSFHAANDPAALKVRPVPPEAITSSTSAPDYLVVAQQNPFHPERNDAMPPPPPGAAKTVGPPPLVYGSMLLGKEKFALMATESDPKPRKIVEGDSINGYKLAEVKAQSVVLEADGSKSEVMFYNALSRLRREPPQKTEPRPAAAAATSPAATVANATADPPQPTVAVPPGKKVIQGLFGPMIVDK